MDIARAWEGHHAASLTWLVYDWDAVYNHLDILRACLTRLGSSARNIRGLWDCGKYSHGAVSGDDS